MLMLKLEGKMIKSISAIIFALIICGCSKVSMDTKFSSEDYCSDIEKLIKTESKLANYKSKIVCSIISEFTAEYNNKSYSEVFELVDSILLDFEKEQVFFRTNITLQKHFTDSTTTFHDMPNGKSGKLDFGIYYPWVMEFYDTQDVKTMRAQKNGNIRKIKAYFMNDMENYLEITGSAAMSLRHDEYIQAKKENEENLFLDLVVGDLDDYLNNRDFKKAFYNDLKENKFETDIRIWYDKLVEVHSEIVDDQDFIQERKRARRKRTTNSIN